MLRRFLSDTRGNYMLMTAVAIVPILGGLALAVDYTEMSRQRQLTLNALDAAGIATARRVIDGATDAELIAYAQDFFEANLGDVDPADATLSIVLPANNAGGGTLKLTADLTYHPHFIPAFSALMGKEGGTTEISFNATSEIRLKNTLEVALVLDNSGSMDFTGSGSGKKRLVLLKAAAKELVKKLAAQAGQMKQVSKPVQFGVVPFAGSVNVGSQYANASWMDTEGRSPIHHENFNWTAFSGSNKKIELQGGVYKKKGSDWNDDEGEIVTRFTLFDEMKRITGSGWESDWQQVCKFWWKGSCYWWEWQDVGGYQNSYAPYASWDGCVEVRPVPYNRDDTTPSSSNPATLFVPSFAPDETDNRDNWNRSSHGDYWYDGMNGTGNDKQRQSDTKKYFDPAPNGTPAAGFDRGPNQSCTTTPITPLTDVTTAAGLDTVEDAIDAMQSSGATNVPQGIAWGWRVVSGGEPFAEGRPDSENGNDKVVIVLTDGENTYYTPGTFGYNDLANNKSIYSAYGYAGRNQPGESKSRLFMSTTASSSDYSNGNYSKAMNQHMLATCGNAKDKGVIVMTVALDLSTSNTAQKEQIASLTECSSDSRFRRDSSDPTKPAKLFWNTTGGNLSDTFKEIADELSNLRIVG
ncbi:MAG: TadE/TadG family type IV pilus assembly protein [Rhizobiaceae bacterium]